MFGDEDPLENLRNFMYPDCDEPHLTDLSNSDTVEDIFHIHRRMEEDGITLEATHTTQSVASLYHIMKLKYQEKLQEGIGMEASQLAMNDILDELLAKEEFENLVNALLHHVDDIDLERLSYVFLCLRKMRVLFDEPIMEKMFLKMQRNMNEMNGVALSYFAVALRYHSAVESQFRETTLFPLLALAPALSHVRCLIEDAKTAEDLKSVAIIFGSCSRVVSEDLMLAYNEKLSQLIDEGKFSGDEAMDSICKILGLILNKRDWHQSQRHMTRKLLLLLRGKVNRLRPMQLLIVAKLAVDQFDPVSLFYEVEKACSDQYEKCKNSSWDVSATALDFYRVMAMAKVRVFRRAEVHQVLKDALESPECKWNFNNMHDIMKSTGFNDPEIKDLFFAKVIEHLKDSPHELTRLSYRYAFFYTKINYKHRCRTFEDFLLQEFSHSVLDCPYTFRSAGQLSFLLSFGDVLDDAISEKLLRIIDHMEPLSLLLLSRGLDNRADMFKKQEDPMKDVTTQAATKIIKRALNHLRNYDDFISRKQILATLQNLAVHMDANQLKEAAGVVYGNVDKAKLSIHGLRLLFRSMVVIAPEASVSNLLDDVVNFIMENRVHLHAHIVLNALSICFVVNHEIKNKKFLEVCNSCLIRDINTVNGMDVLNRALALVHARHFTPELAELIFSVKFMEKLDYEMEFSEPKSRYVTNARMAFMALNRAVCLFYPEYEIPWFHEKYCQESHRHMLAAKNREDARKLKDDIYEKLAEATGGYRYIRENVFSPYYNIIDFELMIGKDGLPVSWREGDSRSDFSVINRSKPGETDGKRLAVVVMNNDDFYANGTTMTGRSFMEVDLLEAQGYDVVVVDPKQWNKMSMGGKGEKEKFFRINVSQASNLS